MVNFKVSEKSDNKITVVLKLVLKLYENYYTLEVN